jgi:hypothetical protein
VSQAEVVSQLVHECAPNIEDAGRDANIVDFGTERNDEIVPINLRESRSA